MNCCRISVVLCVILLSVLSVGCQTFERALPMQADFAKLKVGESTASEVLNLLPEEGMLQTANSVCAFNRHGWSRETGIVTFSETESTVQRKQYVQHRSKQLFPLVKTEEILLTIQTIVPEDVLEASYENDMRKNIAILRYCHESLIADAKPFAEDQETESLIGLARSALKVGIGELAKRPRRARDLLRPEGFVFDHFNLDKCAMFLRQDSENVFSVKVTAGGLVDPWVPW